MNSSSDSAKCPRCGSLLPTDAIAGLCPRCLMLGAMEPTQAGGTTGTLPPPSPEEIAAYFPQLEIIELLGRGGMGVVYKARQKALGRLVALKLIAPERIAEPTFAERFTHEAKALAALSHPNIVTIHDFGEAGGFYYLLMEYVDGVNLRQAMKAGRFTPEQALAIVPPVCEALQYAHDHGIVHRDIKPENLLLDKAGRVKIADFGIAKMLGAQTPLITSAVEQEKATGTFASAAGTPQYMAPEQKTHGRTDHRADIYSLGVVLYELLTGELPADKLQPPSRKVQIDVRLDEIVLRALEQAPELRYQTAGEFRTQVEAAAVEGNARAAVREVEPRFSRTAIVGAVWIAFWMIATLLFFYNSKEPVFGVPPPFIAALVKFLLILLLLVGITAPLGATILGWAAVSQIRRSAGKRWGLGLAVFDGLLFPLLTLDGLLWWLWPIVIKMLMGSSFDTRQYLESWNPDVTTRAIQESTFVAATLTALVVDSLIVSRVWRAVRMPREYTNTAAVPPGGASGNSPLSLAAFFFVLVSTILGSLIWCRVLEPLPALIYSILGAALFGVLLAIPVRTHPLGKQALWIGSINAGVWLLIALAGLRAPAAAANAAGKPANKMVVPTAVPNSPVTGGASPKTNIQIRPPPPSQTLPPEETPLDDAAATRLPSSNHLPPPGVSTGLSQEAATGGSTTELEEGGVKGSKRLALEMAIPYVQEGYTLREDYWGGDLGVKERQVIARSAAPRRA